MMGWECAGVPGRRYAGVLRSLGPELRRSENWEAESQGFTAPTLRVSRFASHTLGTHLFLPARSGPGPLPPFSAFPALPVFAPLGAFWVFPRGFFSSTTSW